MPMFCCNESFAKTCRNGEPGYELYPCGADVSLGFEAETFYSPESAQRIIMPSGGYGNDRYFHSFSNIFMYGQHIIKLLRTIPGVERILGKNGAPVADSRFILEWGLRGTKHRKLGYPIGGPGGACKRLIIMRNNNIG